MENSKNGTEPISWRAFFDSHGDEPPRPFLAELLLQVALLLRNCPADVQKLFLAELSELITTTDA